MRRLIPPKTKESTVLFMNFTVADICVFVTYVLLLYLETFANYVDWLKLSLMFLTILLMIVSLMNTGDCRGYVWMWNLLKFWFRPKTIKAIGFTEATNCTFDKNIVINKDGYSSICIEIKGIDFGILDEEKQNRIIEQLGNVYKNIKMGKIVKIDVPIDVHTYIDQNDEKLAEQMVLYEAIKKDYPNEDLHGLENKMSIIENSSNILNYCQEEKTLKMESFYLFLYDSSKETLINTAETCVKLLNNASIESEIVNETKMKQVYEIFYGDSIVDGNFVLPEVKEKYNRLTIRGEDYRIASFSQLPMYCDNAWAWELFAIPGTKVVMDFAINDNKKKITRAINKTMVELQSRYIAKGATESTKQDIEASLTSLGSLLSQLKLDNESLHTVNYYIIYPADKYQDVADVFHSNNIYLDKLIFKQQRAYMAMNLYTPQTDKVANNEKNLQSSCLAAMMPFVSKAFLDPHGDFLGTSRYPVFFDLFASWRKQSKRRTNANMCVLGKSGGGKSYFLKKLLMQQACDGTKIFVLDPENEYDYLTDVLQGNWIDVGGVGDGVINPLQVFPSFVDSDEESETLGQVSSHRQFLQAWFKTVMPDLDTEAMPYLNQAIAHVYEAKNITNKTDISKLNPSDFPIMEDVCNEADSMLQEAMGSNTKISEYDSSCLKKLTNALLDFKEGGIHAKLWNGHTTLELDNDFTVLNFQSLFANNNMLVANGQMLLVMRFLEQETIKNYNLNKSGEANGNILIAIDEAHRFVNSKFPVALNFMAKMIKQIRKYGGSMIPATQNIKDFIGTSEEARASATAVINGCQYSAIFGLMPDDVNSILELYRSYNGGLTKQESNFIVDAECGQALFMIDSNTRIQCKIELFDDEEQFIERPKI